jgi:hypothetical protein
VVDFIERLSSVPVKYWYSFGGVWVGRLENASENRVVVDSDYSFGAALGMTIWIKGMEGDRGVISKLRHQVKRKISIFYFLWLLTDIRNSRILNS